MNYFVSIAITPMLRHLQFPSSFVFWFISHFFFIPFFLHHFLIFFFPFFFYKCSLHHSCFVVAFFPLQFATHQKSYGVHCIWLFIVVYQVQLFIIVCHVLLLDIGCHVQLFAIVHCSSMFLLFIILVVVYHSFALVVACPLGALGCCLSL